MEVETYDLVVVGQGPAAATAVRAGLRCGARVALAEPGSFDAVLQLWAADQVVQRVLSVDVAGLAGSGAGCDEWTAVRTSGRLWKPVLREQPGLTVLRGRASFKRPDALEVGGREIRFRRSILIPPQKLVRIEVDGSREADCLTADRLLDLAELPSRFGVIGTGPRPCACAQALARLGCEVHLVGREPAILTQEPPETAALVARQMERDGIRLHLNSTGLAVEKTGSQKGLLIDRNSGKEKLFVDEILLDVTCQTDLADLDLHAARIAAADGRIVVDRCLRTTNRRILAAGDPDGDCSSCEFIEAAARHAAENVFRWIPHKFDRLTVPRCVWTSPQIFHLGRTQVEIPPEIAVDAYRVSLDDMNSSVAGEQGFVEVYVRRTTGRLLGACLAAHGAADLLPPLALVMAHRLPLSALADLIPSGPIRFQTLHRLADTCLHGPQPTFRNTLAELCRLTWPYCRP